MNENTRALLTTWRDDIEKELATANGQLPAAQAAHEAAQAAVRSESARIGDLSATIGAFPGRADLANALRNRLLEAAKPSSAASPNGPANRVAELEFKIADLKEALKQIDTLLQPPAPKLEPDPAPVSTTAADFDPIVPARAAA